MNTLEAIRTRRSIRSYKSEMPKMEDINKILEAGIQAPTGKNTQGVTLIAITDKQTRDRYARTNATVLGRDIDPFYGAPVIIIALVKVGVPCQDYDGPIALENMMLAAHELGLGSCWIHRARQTFEMPEWQQWLKEIGCEGEYVGVGNLAIGYIDGEYPPEKEKNPGRIFIV